MNFYQQLKNIYHFFQAHAWRLTYGRPDRGMQIYGVTGTNGKTTTCYLLDSIFAAAYGRPQVGMLSTVAWRLGEWEEHNVTKMTTLPSRRVYQLLQAMQRGGVRYVVLEMTSHALDQHRLAGITLVGAIILNLEREHLDYHRTMQQYGRAKGEIVHYLAPGAPLVIRDTVLEKIFIPRDKFHQLKLIRFTAEQARSVTTPLPGAFNQENALAASLLARAAGAPEQAIAEGIAVVQHVPGRMQWIVEPGMARVLIDYAVTPDALARLYSYVRTHTGGNIFAVLGAAGKRDRGKRPAMAQAVAAYADEIVLTREDPWMEDEEQIFSDLERGLTAFAAWRRVPDRREAIAYCLSKAVAQDVVVITGKGAERGMAVGREIISWSDSEVVRELLRENRAR